MKYLQTLRPILRALDAYSPEVAGAMHHELRAWHLAGTEDLDWIAAEATWWLSTLWHGGQACPLCLAGCVSGFSPGMSSTRPESMEAVLVFNEVEAVIARREGRKPCPFDFEGAAA